MSAPPIAWSIAGSDSGGGAGLQADLRAFAAFGVHGCSAVAAITAQNSVAVQAIEAVSPQMLRSQLQALAADMAPGAVKTGMLGSVENLRVVVETIDGLRAGRAPTPAFPQGGRELPLVVDPVLRSTTGKAFADAALLQACRQELLPRTTLLTPNRAEAAGLLGLPGLQTRTDVEQAARALREAGCRAVVITGGDDGGDSSDDYLASELTSGWLSLPRIATPHHHGSGCTFAASAAAALALGYVLPDAVVLAKMATAEALRHAHAAGAGAGPVRPREGFALAIDNLPAFGPVPGPAAAGFAPLAQPDLGLYAIVDSAAWVRRVLAAGVRTVQLRIKEADPGLLRDQVREAIAAAFRARAQLFINDHWRLAIEEGAYGVHLGQEDLDVADLEAIRSAGLRLGLSTHAYWEVARAWALRPSYIACGPIHPTRAKAMPWVPQGNGNLAHWCRLLPAPVVAIAGMDAPRAAEARACGAAGVAVIAAITGAADPEGAIRELQQAMDRHPAALPVPALARPTLAMSS